ncbi:SDR family NAD(P)-dependent oxidoreductase, partial [Aestuariivirga sp.]|uniref:SDR family NAD(P)-dependent oxidoreductase n=1 Tax=Aestuariivirga sp. TaxID=2650926 RepID=UPI003017B85C
MDFENKGAIVTGGGAGMGQAHAELFASRGATVVVQDIAGERAKEIAARIVKSGGRAHALVCDVADTAALTEALKQIVTELG